MCGRGSQNLSWRRIVELLRLPSEAPALNLQPNWNAAPTQTIYVCAEVDGARRIEPMRWGLIPAWARETPKYATFNAKWESLDKPTWRGSLRAMRCIVPFSGFFEWTGPKGAKQPYYVTRKDGDPLLMAGLWAVNDRVGEAVRSATIITCAPNLAMARLHTRMPVILSPEAADAWLSGGWDDSKEALLAPCPDDWLTAAPVGRDVGAVRHNRADLTTPIGAPLF